MRRLVKQIHSHFNCITFTTISKIHYLAVTLFDLRSILTVPFAITQSYLVLTGRKSAFKWYMTWLCVMKKVDTHPMSFYDILR